MDHEKPTMKISYKQILALINKQLKFFIEENPMAKMSTILIVGALLVSVNTVSMQVTCQKCSSVCSQPNCILVTGTNYSDQICNPASSCDLTLVKNYTVKGCATDFRSYSCSSQLCFTPQYTVISSDSFGFTNCSQPYWVYSSCDTCTTADCSRCLYDHYSFKQTIDSTCRGAACTLPPYNITVSYCADTHDDLGTPSSCCTNLTSTGLGVCTRDTRTFNSQKFTAYGKEMWAKQLAQAQTDKNKFDMHVKLSMGVIMALILVSLTIGF